MSYLVITRESANKIYTSSDPEIELISFRSEEDAQHYLKNNGSLYSVQIRGEQTSNKDKNLSTIIKNKDKRDIYVFTDGSCNNNGFRDATAGIGIYFGKGDPRNVSRKISGRQTNNTAEIAAVIHVFTVLEKEIKEGHNIIIYTDSKYTIQCSGEYGEKCEKSNWKNSKGYIINHDLVKVLYSLCKQHDNVILKHVKGHSKDKDEFLSDGNKQAHILAYHSINK